MFLLALRRMFRCKWMIVCLLVGTIMATSIVSCIPIYTDGILQRMLTRDLENSQKETGIYPGAYCFSADLQYTFDYKDRPKAFNFFNQRIVGGLADSFSLPILAKQREIEIDGFEMITMDLDGEETKKYIDLLSMDEIEDHINITNGRMCSKDCVDGVYETIVTSSAMRELNILLNEEYEVSSMIPDYEDYRYKVRVVGVFTTKDPSDLYWNKSLSEYTNMFVMDSELFNRDFIAQNNVLITKAQWYYALDYHEISIGSIDHILGEYTKQVEWLKKYRSALQLSVPAIPILEEYLERSNQLKTALWVLTVPILIMLAFYIFMISQLIVMQDENGIAVQKSRGAGKFQIFRSYFYESLIVGILALVTGPPLGMLFCRVLGSANGFLEFVDRTALPINLKSSYIIYSLIAVIVYMITMLIPVFAISKTSIVNYKQKMVRNSKQPLWKKFFLDILVLVTSIFGIYLFRQQQDMLKGTGIYAAEISVNPLFFLTSTLFMLGVGLFFLRLYPYMIRIIHWLGRKFWTPVVYASLIQVGRSRGREQFLMLFIILAISSGIYSSNSARTINRNLEDRINYQNGADMTLMAVWEDNQTDIISGMSAVGGMGQTSQPQKKEPHMYYEPDYTKYSTLSGTEKATKVISVGNAEAQCYDSSLKNIRLMGIIPEEFAGIAWFRNDLLPVHWYNYINWMIDAPTAILLSTDLKDRLKVKIGDTIYVSWGNQSYIEGIVYAFVDYWPTYNPNPPVTGSEPSGLIVANYNYIRNKLALQPYEVWIKKKEGATDKQINDDIVQRELEIDKISYTNQQLIKAKNDPMLQGLNGTLTLGFIAAMFISTLGFLIYWILSIQSRVLHFGIMRAMGLSRAKVTGMIACEQVLVSGVAILMGFVIGGIACDLFVPMLQIAFSSADHVPPFKIIAAAGDYMKIYTVTAGMMVVGLGILWRIIAKIRIDQAVKLGED